MTKRLIVILSLAVPAVAGCGHSGARTAADAGAGRAPYQTIGTDPRRDLDLARRENARALDLMAGGEDAEAERALRAALTADVTYGPAHNSLGKLYFRQGKMYWAAWEFQYAIKLMPNQPEPRNNLGLVFERVGKLDDAVEWYGKAKALEPDNAHATANLARARVGRGDRDDETKSLLSEIVMKDGRAEWVEWARDKLKLTFLPKPGTGP